MNRRRALPFLRLFGLLAAILMATVAGTAPSAFATDTPGNNGTVKIHEGAGESDPGEVRNEPHVCTFHLHFYFADPEQSGTWEIQQWAPTGVKGTVVLSGTYDTAGDGVDRQPETGVYQLPDGHYKLFWDGDTSKHDKMKVFWVDCPTPTTAPSAAPSATGSELPTSSASTSPSESVSPTESVTPSATPTATPTASMTESPSGSLTPTESIAPTPTPTGSELPIESSTPSMSTAPTPTPTGSELAAEGSPSPTGGVEGITGTPATGVTPPPTDTANLAPAAGNDGWRVILMAIAALTAAAVFLIPRSADEERTRGRRRG